MRDPEPQSSARASGSPTSRTGSSALGHSLRFSALTLITWPSLRHLTAQRPGPVTDVSSCDANRLPTVPFKSGRDLRPVKIQCAPTTNGRVGGQSSDDMRQSVSAAQPGTLCSALGTFRTGKKTPGGAGTHTGHTGARGQTDRFKDSGGSRDTRAAHGRTRAHGRHSVEPHNHPNPPTHPHDRRCRDLDGPSTKVAATNPVRRGALAASQVKSSQRLLTCLDVTLAGRGALARRRVFAPCFSSASVFEPNAGDNRCNRGLHAAGAGERGAAD